MYNNYRHRDSILLIPNKDRTVTLEIETAYSVTNHKFVGIKINRIRLCYRLYAWT